MHGSHHQSRGHKKWMEKNNTEEQYVSILTRFMVAAIQSASQQGTWSTFLQCLATCLE